MKSAEIKITFCPYCGSRNNRATCAVNARPDEGETPDPEEGDLSICNRCGGTLRFNADLEAEKLGPEHLDDYSPKILTSVLANSLAIKQRIIEKEFKEKLR